MTDPAPADATSAPQPGPIARHYGMDWLRVGAFALLIVYHIGMVFVPWNFHIKARVTHDWVILPMLALNAWRLGLLFVVSGYASRALLTRSSGLAGFARNRSSRLLVPLLFGIVVIVPPQSWIELVTKHHYDRDFLSFWFGDYFSFATRYGLFMPNWNHLWFVAYLWVYTMALCLLLVLARGATAQRIYDRVFGGWGVLLVPLAWGLMVHVWVLPFSGETHSLFDDWIAHAIYFPAFLFGFGLAGSSAAMAAIRRVWRVAAVMAVAGFAMKFSVDFLRPHHPDLSEILRPGYSFGHAFQQWGAIIALIGMADRYWNRPHRWRQTLTEGVFPFYIAHQTIIIVVMWLLLRTALPGWAEFAITLAATVAGCWAFYWVGRSIPWLRPLIGLRPRVRSAVKPGAIPAASA